MKQEVNGPVIFDDEKENNEEEEDDDDDEIDSEKLRAYEMSKLR